MRDIVKIALLYGVCVLVFQIVSLSDLVWVLFPAVVIGPILVPVVALLITRKIQVADWRLNFLFYHFYFTALAWLLTLWHFGFQLEEACFQPEITFGIH